MSPRVPNDIHWGLICVGSRPNAEGVLVLCGVSGPRIKQTKYLEYTNIRKQKIMFIIACSLATFSAEQIIYSSTSPEDEHTFPRY